MLDSGMGFEDISVDLLSDFEGEVEEGDVRSIPIQGVCHSVATHAGDNAQT